MDRKKKTAKPQALAVLTRWGVVVIGLTAAGFAYEAGYFGGHLSKQDMASRKGAAPAPQGLIATYRAAWYSAQEKAGEIERALEENERLRYENTNLRLKLETLQFEAREKAAQAETRKIGAQTAQDTGSRVARTLASIGYRPPTELLPNQLYTLGVTYFKANENEKAAVILSFLTNMEDNTAYQSAKNYLMAGVAWYRLQNFEMAKTCFEQALKQPDTAENERYQAQARLWQGLVAEYFKRNTEAQYWLGELVDHHPHSMEAEWVNGREPAGSNP